jgi:hypothetical protein
MIKFLWVMVLGFIVNTQVWAQDFKIIHFQQQFNLGTDEGILLEIGNINLSTQFWTVLYVVGQQSTPNRTATMDLVVLPMGAIDKSTAQTEAIVTKLIAEDLPLRKKYSLKEFSAIEDAIEDDTDQKIQDPVLSSKDNIRAYAQVIDWVPEYDQKKIEFQIGFPNQNGFKPAAVYLMVGEGEKPRQIAQLVQQNSNLTKEQMEDKFRDIHKSPETRLMKFETRLMIFFVLAAFFAFLYWGKWRRD